MREKMSSEAPKNYFERQFSRREHIRVDSDHSSSIEVDVVDIAPEKQSEKMPLVLDPAWSCGIDVYKYVLKGFTDAGRRAICFDHPRYGGSILLSEDEKALVEGLPVEEVRKALTLIAILKEKALDESAVLGHSEAAASACIAALLLASRAKRGIPGPRIKNLVLYGPAGLIGKDTLARLGKGFLSQPSIRGSRPESMADSSEWSSRPTREDAETARSEEVARAAREGRAPQIGEIPRYAEVPETDEDRAGGAAAIKGFAPYTLHNPLRTAKEIWGLSKMQIHPLLRALKKEGVGILVMSGVDDPVFPIEKLSRTISDQKETNDEDITAILDGFYSLRGEHPLPVPYAGIIEGQISALEKKQSRSN